MSLDLHAVELLDDGLPLERLPDGTAAAISCLPCFPCGASVSCPSLCLASTTSASP
jgi:hypothetical protein